MLNDIENFWKMDDILPRDSLVYQEIQSILKLRSFILHLYIYGGWIHITCFLVTPLFYKERRLPLDAWLPHNAASPYYEIMYLIQCYLILITLSIIGGFDGLYASICAAIAVQFKLIGHCLTNLDMNGKGELKEGQKSVKDCVEHHCYILK